MSISPAPNLLANRAVPGKRLTVGINTLFLIPGEVGGSETYFVQTLSAMLEGPNPPAFVLFTHLENDAFLRSIFSKYPQVAFCRLDFKASSRVTRILREQFELPFRAGRYALDLLWSPGYTAPLLAQCPQVISILDMQYKNFPGDFSWFATKVMDLLIQSISGKHSSVVTISEFSKTEILKYTRIPVSRIFVTPLASHRDFSKQASSCPLPEIIGRFLSEGASYLLCVSNTYPHKNVSSLIKAFGKLSPHFHHKLVLVGKPARGEKEVQKAIADLPTERKVIRLENLSRENLTALYQHADLFVFPSLYEGFGLPVLEAMMAGAPVLTTRCASIPEVAGDGALYFDPRIEGDFHAQIERALGMSQEERLLLIERGKTRAEGFSWDSTAEGTLRFFRAISDNSTP